MQPKLFVLSGPLGKSEFPLGEGVSIGRDVSNAVRIEDAAVSARHCQIVRENGEFVVMDLGSASGTFVNGIQVTQRALAAGDQIGVGSSLLAFQAGGEASPVLASSRVELDERAAASGKEQELRQEELLYLHPESLAALPHSERLDRTLRTLLKISAAIGSIRNVESLQWQLLGMIFDVIPAERGAILLRQDGATENFSEIAWDRVSGPEQPVHVSRTLARRVMEQGVAVLDNEGQSLGPDTSAERRSARALLCVPLASADRPWGIVYVDSSNALTKFVQDDLQLLAAIAGLAAVGIENARHFERLDNENQRLRAEINLQHDMVGQSPRMQQVYRFIEKVAPTDSTVLISGESGTGKELAARAVHQNSGRRERPFVAVNCAALTETLLESELFGHEKGAFTSAICQKKGWLEVGEGGSVFLDEIGELSLTLQAKLLRVLQEREFVRVGGTRAIKLNVRFLAATNKDLPKEVREGRFRADLFHRLNVIALALPALREHAEDIPMLAEYFAARYAKRCNREVKGISSEARASLLQYDWPGNIRELENAMERAVVIGCSEFVVPEDLPETILESAPNALSFGNYHQAVRELKKRLISQAFEQAGGNVTEAAKTLGVNANYLHRLIRNLDLREVLKKAAQEP